MGHQSAIRDMRKQIRNVAQQQYPTFLQEESVQALEKRLLKLTSDRLDEVAKNVDKQLAAMDQQTRVFRSMLMNDASGQISRELTSISVTMLAWQEVLVGKLKLENIDEFTAEVEAKKTEIFTRLEAEAKAKEEAEKAAAELKAAEAALTEAPAEQTATDPAIE